MVTFLIRARTCDPIKNRILTPTSAPPTVGEEGVLFYSLMNSGGLDLTHTEVPTSQRGRGLGAVLAKVCRSRLALSPGPTQKSGKGPGVTCKDSCMCCVSSLRLE